MAPTLVAAYFVRSSGMSADTISTPSFTPSAGEVIVVKMETWSTGVSLGPPSGGGLTWTVQVVMAPGGFRPWVGIATAVVAESPGPMSVSASPSASARYSMVVERWSQAQLAGSPAVASADGGTGAASASLTTTADGSVVAWVAGDAQSQDPSARAYLSSAVEDGLRDDHVGANGVAYHAWQQAGVAGAQPFGLSAPTGMQWCIAGIEVLAAGGTVLTASASGASSSAGAAAAVALLAAAAPGAAATTGHAAVAVTLAGAAHGSSIAAGAAALVLAMAAAASGAASAAGRAAATIPGSLVERPNTGTVVRPDTGVVARPNTGTVLRP